MSAAYCPGPAVDFRKRAKDEMSKMEKHNSHRLLITAAVVAGVFVLAVAGALIWLTRGLGTYSRLTIRDIDLADVPDGTYRGDFDGGRWSNSVEVTVENNRIGDISVVKDVRFKRAGVSKELFARVEKQQSLVVDAVSGATVTCKAYLKSIENALEGSLSE